MASRTAGKEEYYIVVLGMGGIGKTSVITQFVSNSFTETYDPTREVIDKKEITVGGQPCIVEIGEASGDVEHSNLRNSLICSADAAVFMYSISSEASLASVRAIWEEAKATKEEMGTWEPFQMCLIGTMADLEGQREVSREEGESCARGMGCTFRESSAKTRVNIDEPFEELVKKIKTYRDNERIRYDQMKRDADKKKGKKPSPWKKLFSK